MQWGLYDRSQDLALINQAGGLYGRIKINRGRKYRPNAVRSVHTTEVKILPYRLTWLAAYTWSKFGHWNESRIFCIIVRQGKSKHSDWFSLGQDSAIQTISMEMVIGCVFFVFEKRQIQNNMAQVPYNKLLTNLASSSRTGECWPSVVFVRASLRPVRTVATSGQYSPVLPSRSVSKRLLC